MIKAIITDIEGTTSSIRFVHDVLFPYARAHLAGYVRAHANEPAVAEQLAAVSEEVGKPLDTEQAIAQLIAWIDADKKVTPLKALQGLIWEAGYRNGDYQGHMYDDAVECLQKWHTQGIKLYVYSSGSVYAQQLLFGHTQWGDLRALFSGYFDTRIGAKQQADSYRNILTELGLPGNEVLFLSDLEAELDAARAAGLHTTWLVRDATPDTAASHPQVSSFADIRAEN